MTSPIANNDIAMNSPIAANQENHKQKKCGNCGEFGHNKRKCPHSPRVKEVVEKKESNRKCGKCGEFGHNARTCPMIEQCQPCEIVDPEVTIRMEYEERKFWTVVLKDDTTMVCYGKVGTEGRNEAPKKHKSKEKAAEWTGKQIDAKTKKGYQKVYQDEKDFAIQSVKTEEQVEAETESGSETETEAEAEDSIEMLASELTLIPADESEESEDEAPLVDISVLETGLGIFTYSDDGDTISTSIEWLTE